MGFNMGFKKRLVIAFLIILFVPIFLFTTCGVLIINYQLDSIYESYGLEADTLQIIANPMELLNRMTKSTWDEIKRDASANPEILCDTEYQRRINRTLAENNAYLVVMKGGECIYIGNMIKYPSVKDRISELQIMQDINSIDEDGGVYLSGKVPVLVKVQSFTDAAGEQITAYVITDLTVIVPQYRLSAIQAVIAFAGIIVLTAAILVVWLYRSVVRPLRILSDATKRMKIGDLEFTISGDPEDELGQLCEDFEEMRKHLKEQSEVRLQYERDTVELITNISHDLKTPLTAIKGYTEGIMDGVADTEEKRNKYLRTIYTKAADMAVLVDELSFYTKIDSNIVTYNFEKLNIDEYFEDCVDEQSLDMELKNTVLSYHSNLEPGVLVLADPEQLRRVVNNVLGNAIKYLDKPEGKIDIRTLDNGEFVLIEIEDNGAGIEEKDLPYVFDRFYRADTSRSSKKGGTGLGLAIAKKIIEDHSGRIRVTSEYGVGTTIMFTLPKWIEGSRLAEVFDEIEDAEYTSKPNVIRRVWDRSRFKKEKPKAKDKDKSTETDKE